MGKMNTGHSAFSSGPELTQAVPTAQHVDTIPTMYGIPHMSLDSVFAEDVKLHPAHYEPSESVLGRYKRQAEEPFGKNVEFAPEHSHIPNKNHPEDPTSSTMRHAGDDDTEPPMEDAHPIKPFHDVLRREGFSPSHSERKGDTRVNHYAKVRESGEPDRVELHHDQGRGPSFGSTNSIAHSGDPEATAPRVNNSPEKLHRNIHAQSYRAPDEGIKPKMKPGEIREYASKIKGDAVEHKDALKEARSEGRPHTTALKPGGSRKERPVGMHWNELEPSSHAEAEQMEERHGPRGDEY